MQRADLAHHGLVDAQAAGRVQDQHVVVMAACVVDRVAGDVLGLLAGVGRQEVHADLRGHGLQLLDGGGTVDVGRHHQHFLLAGLAAVLSVLALGQPARQLAGGGGLARACRPAIRITAGGCTASDSSPESAPRSPPISAVSSLGTTPTRAWPGLRLPATSSPSALSLTRATNSRTTGARRPPAGPCALRAASPGCWLGQAGFAAQRLDDARQALS